MQWAGLEPNTDYSIFARIAVTNTKNASPASEPTTVRTLADQSRTHTVTWKNADGTTLQTETVLYGDTPVFQGETPKKAADVKYTYVFKGWMPAIARVTADVTYTATYDETVNKYKVTFVDYDGSTVLKETAEYDYGTPAANVKRPADPTREADAQHAYKFAGWTPEVADVTGDATYKATYAEVAKKGTLTFDLGGGTIEGKTSLTIEANVGDVITIPEAPVRDGYTFKYWKGSEYYPGDKYTVEGDHTFAAVWERSRMAAAAAAAAAATAAAIPTRGALHRTHLERARRPRPATSSAERLQRLAPRLYVRSASRSSPRIDGGYAHVALTLTKGHRVCNRMRGRFSYSFVSKIGV